MTLFYWHITSAIHPDRAEWSSPWLEPPEKFLTEREEYSGEWCPFNISLESAGRVPFFFHKRGRADLLLKGQWASLYTWHWGIQTGGMESFHRQL